MVHKRITVKKMRITKVQEEILLRDPHFKKGMLRTDKQGVRWLLKHPHGNPLKKRHPRNWLD